MTPVTIRRDPYGIAHVTTGDDQDFFHAQGYVHACDRMVQMDRDRKTAYGRLAELDGAAGVASDRFWRPMGIARVVAEEWEGLDPETRAMLEAYAAGVNRGFRRHESLYRQEGWPLHPWRPQDSLAVLKVRHLLMGVFERKLWWGRLLSRLGPERFVDVLHKLAGETLVMVPPGVTATGPDIPITAAEFPPASAASDGAGSNNWVVAGFRTESGFPLVAGDPHRAVELPNVYYPIHLQSARLNVIGLTFAGVPGFPHFGHNPDVAWAITHTAADTQDLYLESEDDVSESWLETIVVRGGEPVEITLECTPRGPVIGRLGDRRLAVRATALEPEPRQYACLHRMLRAKTVPELYDALSTWVDPVNNLVAGDRSGHIGYLMRGRVPMRSRANFFAPVPGGDPRFAWTGYIPYDEWPRVLDPEDGVVVTANNRVTTPDFPYPIAPLFTPEYRARRIWDLLHARNAPWSADTIPEVHRDVSPPPALRLARRARAISPATPLESEARMLLTSWDGVMSRDGAAPLVYATWREHITRAVFARLVGDDLARDLSDPAWPGAAQTYNRLRARVVELVDARDTLFTPAAEWDAMLGRTFSAAVADLEQKYGPEPSHWHWGDAHRLRVNPPVRLSGQAQPPSIDIPLPGDGESVRAASFGPDNFLVTGTSVARYVFDIADWDRSRWVLPGGVAERGEYAQNLLAAWAEGEFVPMWYSDTAVAEHTRVVDTLEPEA
ncbi:MAG: penicillin acylase family protein [Clostridia bacterium]